MSVNDIPTILQVNVLIYIQLESTIDKSNKKSIKWISMFHETAWCIVSKNFGGSALIFC